MPTYHYQCRACENEFDLFQSIKASTVAPCPKCQGEASRLFSSGSGVHYKGSGFYLTDYKGSKKKGDKKAESAPAPTPCAAASSSCASAGCPAAQAAS